MFFHNIQCNQFAHLLLLLFLCLFCGGILSIRIDNNIIGEPDIECFDQEIRVWVKTRKNFNGRIYAKGKSEDPDCSKEDFEHKRTKKPHFDLPLGMCGMKQQRSFDPRGMYYSITLVISFHTLFITKVDQAFHVKCFFEEASRGLTAKLGVSMIPTTEIQARHSIPGCTYSIHRSSILALDAGRPPGVSIQFAKVGDKVLHQWHCDDQMYGILIRNCYVTDGVKKKAFVIDAKGCPVNPIVITGIRYSSDMQRAYAESQVFKFADRPGVWFFCQIQMCMKKNGMCDGITPPECATTSRLSYSDRNGNLTDSNNLTDDFYTDTRENSSTKQNTNYYTTETPLLNRRNEEKNQKSTKDYESGIDNIVDSGKEETSKARERGKTKQPLRPPLRQQEQIKMLDGYGIAPVHGPSVIEYENNEDETSKTISVFGPGYSQSQSSNSLTAGSKSDSSVYAYGDESMLLREQKAGNSETNLINSGYGVENENRNIEKDFQQKSTKIRTQEITTDFESTDDLTSQGEGILTQTTTFNPFFSTKLGTDNTDYNKNENSDTEVTIPPNLVDLLANLPADQINADNLQKMFRDSVADRRALLNGFDALINKIKKDEVIENSEETTSTSSIQKKNIMNIRQLATSKMIPGSKINLMHVMWDSSQQRQKDSPFPNLVVVNRAENQTTKKKKSILSPSLLAKTASGQPESELIEPPMIAGQLLIYDLDEVPPDEMNTAAQVDDQANNEDHSQCALTRHGMFLLGSCMSSLITALIVIIIALFFKVCKTPSTDYYQKSSNNNRDLFKT